MQKNKKIALKKEHEIKIETLMIMTFLKLKRKNAGLAKSSKKKAQVSKADLDCNLLTV